MPWNPDPNDAIAVVRDGYCTDRLQFMRMAKNDPGVYDYFATRLDEPEFYALTMNQLLRPQSRADIENIVAEYAQALLPVMICFPYEFDDIPEIIGALVIGKESRTKAQNRTVSIVLSIHHVYQNEGFGREALDWALDWCFEHADMHTVSVTVASYNEIAMYLFKSMGFVEEGRNREVLRLKGKWYDNVHYSMTEEEWKALRSK